MKWLHFNAKEGAGFGSANVYLTFNIEQGSTVRCNCPIHRPPLETKACSKDTPTWNEDFSMPYHSNKDKLVVKAWKVKSFVKNECLGSVEIELTMVSDNGNSLEQWFHLIPDCEGRIEQKEQTVALARAGGGGAGLIRMRICSTDELIRGNRVSHFLSEDEANAEVKAKEWTAEAELMTTTQVLKEHKETLSLRLVTWNIGRSCPPTDLTELLPTDVTADLVVIGAQECQFAVPTDMMGKPQHSNAEAAWIASIAAHLGTKYIRIGLQSMREIRMVAFVKNSVAGCVTNVQASSKATGIGGVLGNKGAVAISFDWSHTALCFVNAHLAPHQDRTPCRNSQIQTVLNGMKLRPKKGESSGTSGILDQFDQIFFFGDLNYRLRDSSAGNRQSEERVPSKQSFHEILSMVAQKDWKGLMKKDQLKQQMMKKKALPGFTEGEYHFPPTFKVERGIELRYVPSRLPSYTDRILWRSLCPASVRPILIDSVQSITSSDHKPVFGTFEIDTFVPASSYQSNLGECFMTIRNLQLSGLETGKYNCKLSFSSNVLKETKTAHIAPWGSTVSDAVGPVRLLFNNHHRLRRCWLAVGVCKTGSGGQTMGTGRLLLSVPIQDLPPKRCTFPFTVELTNKAIFSGKLQGEVELEWKSSRMQANPLWKGNNLRKSEPSKLRFSQHFDFAGDLMRELNNTNQSIESKVDDEANLRRKRLQAKLSASPTSHPQAHKSTDAIPSGFIGQSHYQLHKLRVESALQAVENTTNQDQDNKALDSTIQVCSPPLGLTHLGSGCPPSPVSRSARGPTDTKAQSSPSVVIYDARDPLGTLPQLNLLLVDSPISLNRDQERQQYELPPYGHGHGHSRQHSVSNHEQPDNTNVVLVEASPTPPFHRFICSPDNMHSVRITTDFANMTLYDPDFEAEDVTRYGTNANHVSHRYSYQSPSSRTSVSRRSSRGRSRSRSRISRGRSRSRSRGHSTRTNSLSRLSIPHHFFGSSLLSPRTLAKRETNFDPPSTLRAILSPRLGARTSASLDLMSPTAPHARAQVPPPRPPPRVPAARCSQAQSDVIHSSSTSTLNGPKGPAKSLKGPPPLPPKIVGIKACKDSMPREPPPLPVDRRTKDTTTTQMQNRSQAVGSRNPPPLPKRRQVSKASKTESNANMAYTGATFRRSHAPVAPLEVAMWSSCDGDEFASQGSRRRSNAFLVVNNPN